MCERRVVCSVRSVEETVDTPFDYVDDKGNVAEEKIKYWTTDPVDEL